MALKDFDKEIYEATCNELKRQQKNIELIASENFVSKNVLEAQGSILTNKYAEGYPYSRYYGGCQYVDVVENLAIDRAKKLFDAEYVNVQPHSGSQANMAAYRAILRHGDTILGMSLESGGHLTHGYKINFSGQDYNCINYGLDSQGYIDYDMVEKLALEHKPNLIVAGASAYSREIDFARFKKIADMVGAYFMVDMAHIAGLVAGHVCENPLKYADIVTSTTHKTLRGPRGGLILTNSKELAKKINSAVFPKCQGGPLMHIIAAKAVCFKEALQDDFAVYAQHVVENMNAFCLELKRLNYKLVSGGSDNHLVLVNILDSVGLTGAEAEKILESVNITCNKNAVPNDTLPPKVTSGLRIGSAAMTTRGFTKHDFIKTAQLIDKALRHHDDTEVLEEVRQEAISLACANSYL